MTEGRRTLPDDISPRTRAVHGGSRRSQYGEVSEAIFLTQGFVYDSAEAAEARFIEAGADEFIYARYGNPTVAMFEDRIAGLEGTEDAFATASGMAAVNGALTSMLKAGDHVVSSRALFGSCLYILEEVLTRYGVEVTFVDGTDLDQWREAIRPDTKAVFFESISNPTLEVIDIRAVADMAHAVGALVIADNVFATPVLQRSADLGADVIVYSATKHIDGQGRCLGGVICGTRPFHPQGGGALPETYRRGAVAVQRLGDAEIAGNDGPAGARAGRKRVASGRGAGRVAGPQARDLPVPGRHPQHDLARAQMQAGGTVVSFEVEGGRDAAFRFLNALRIVLISNNLGDAKSIVTHPATTTHQRLTPEQRAALGISDGLLRLSVGLEDAGDLIAISRRLSRPCRSGGAPR